MYRSSFEEDLRCPVCSNIFTNPVLLSCSHSFCEGCIQKFWESKAIKTCPLCRRPSFEYPPMNLVLKNLCETYQQERSGICSAHKEKLKLFCLDDQEPVCLVCRDSRKHSNHRFCPVDEAVMDNKEKLKAALKPLQERLRTYHDFKYSLDQTAEYIKIQTQDTEIKMNEQFEELHQFLRDEEAARITALREEEEQRSQMMKEKIGETRRHISFLSCTIRDVEEQMKAEDVSFLKNFKSTLQKAQRRQPDLQNISAVMINVPKYLSNLKLTVLQKMQDNFKKTSCLSHELYDFQCDDLSFGAMAIMDDSSKFTGNECAVGSGGKRSKLSRTMKPTNVNTEDEDQTKINKVKEPICRTYLYKGHTKNKLGNK